MDIIPITPANNNGRVSVTLGSERFWFHPRWNARENNEQGAWMFDIREEDNTLIAGGLKVAIGVQIGYRNPHPFFRKHFLRVVDMSNSGIEAGYDDLGTRILLTHFTLAEFKRTPGA